MACVPQTDPRDACLWNEITNSMVLYTSGGDSAWWITNLYYDYLNRNSAVYICPSQIAYGTYTAFSKDYFRQANTQLARVGMTLKGLPNGNEMGYLQTSITTSNYSASFITGSTKASYAGNLSIVHQDYPSHYGEYFNRLNLLIDKNIKKPADHVLHAEGKREYYSNFWIDTQSNYSLCLRFPHNMNANAACMDGHVEDFKYGTHSVNDPYWHGN